MYSRISQMSNLLFLYILSILAPPLFIEEVAAQPTEELILLILKNSLPPSGYSLYKQRESCNTIPFTPPKGTPTFHSRQTFQKDHPRGLPLASIKKTYFLLKRGRTSGDK